MLLKIRWKLWLFFLCYLILFFGFMYRFSFTKFVLDRCFKTQLRVLSIENFMDTKHSLMNTSKFQLCISIHLIHLFFNQFSMKVVRWFKRRITANQLHLNCISPLIVAFWLYFSFLITLYGYTHKWIKYLQNTQFFLLSVFD